MLGAGEYYYPIYKCATKAGMQKITSCGNMYYYKGLIFLLGSHARGKTLSIYVLDPDVTFDDIMKYGLGKYQLVEVYGPVSGQLGWSEVYGYTEHGPWEKIISEVVDYCKELYIIEQAEEETKKQLQHYTTKEKNKQILDRYRNKYGKDE